MSDFEAEREATIARNRALLAQLDVSLDIPKPKPKEKEKVPAKSRAKPVQPSTKKAKRAASPIPLRSSKRLRRSVADPNETPEQKRKREQEEEKGRKAEEEARLEAEAAAIKAREPRHEDLEMYTLLEDQEAPEVMALTDTLQMVSRTQHPRRVGSADAFDYEDAKEKREISDLKKKFKNMQIVSRAKVTRERVYCAAYHPDVTKDLIFFGDKHGQLGIWDARAPADAKDDDTEVPASQREGGKYWRMQVHWPASSSSSISTIKFDPIDSHSVYTSSYEHTVRRTSFLSGISTEVFHGENEINSIDLTPTGHEMWISDKAGALTHIDLRENKSKARWYQLSEEKIGSVSINPVDSAFLLTASNSRVLRVWDARKLHSLVAGRAAPIEVNYGEVQDFMNVKSNGDLMRAEFPHGKSVSSAYWDPHGRRIVSTSYDNTIKMWDVKPSFLQRSSPFPTFKPLAKFNHNCQTGKWVTVLRAQWSPNPEVYPHFTIANMNKSLDIHGCKGDLLAQLSDKTQITAVQAVTCSHPRIVERAASGNASGRCVLWAPPEPAEADEIAEA